MSELYDPRIPVDEIGERIAAGEETGGKMVSVSTPDSVGQSIYTSKLGQTHFKDVPHSVYFYYIRVNMNGRLEVAHYFYPNVDPGDDPNDTSKWKPIDHSDAALRPIITKLAKNARPGALRPRDPAQSGSRFENVVWERKSYIVIFIDEASWKFHKFPTADPVVFITTGKDGKVGKPNWSFFDALDFEIEMPKFGSTDTDFRSAIAFINHMKANNTDFRDIGEDEHGNPIPNPTPEEKQQLFQFQMYLDVLFANGTSKMTVILDPDGNNLGPPLPPP